MVDGVVGHQYTEYKWNMAIPIKKQVGSPSRLEYDDAPQHTHAHKFQLPQVGVVESAAAAAVCFVIFLEEP